MTLELFSGFDPQNLTPLLTINFSTLMWMIVMVLPVKLQGNYVFFAHPPFRASLGNTLRTIHELISRSQLKNLGGTIPFFLGLMSYLSTLNLSGQAPYVFSATSHMAFNFSLAFPLWFTIILLSFTYSLPLSLSHLTPSSSPLYLAPFLVMIETVSSLVRPLTLAIRMSANITTGHIILSMLSISTLSTSAWWSLILTLLIGMFYTCFEFVIMMIQAYIFTMLPTLYADEHPK